jgi:uncharacterized protein
VVDVHVSRIGFTPLKGTRHVDRSHVDLAVDGPVGDRAFCLVDLARGRVLRTVENPSLMRTSARWHAGVLSASLPGTSVQDVPVRTGEEVKVDYWGRSAALEVVDGPWGAAYSEYLGFDVALARSTGPGEIVYGAPVSLVSTSSLAKISDVTGREVDGAQFRATFTVHTDGEPPHVEDSWLGRTLHIGEAEIEVRTGIPRCAVVDLDPVTGLRRADVLRCLGGYRRSLAQIMFGVDAVVTSPGRVDLGAVVKGS